MRYGLGQILWVGTTEREQREAPCPDCFGSREWQMVSPAGRGYIITCPRCERGYRSSGIPPLTYHVATPKVVKVAVSEVRASERYGTSYSTDPGYTERVIFKTEAEARMNAEWMALWANVGVLLQGLTDPCPVPAVVYAHDMTSAKEKLANRARWEAEYQRDAVFAHLEDCLKTMETHPNIADSWFTDGCASLFERYGWEIEDAE